MNEETKLPKQTEDLVAYVDGELSDEESARIEEQLARDPQLRQQLDELMRAWDLLDDLPRSKATEEFSERTLSTIKIENASSADPSELRSKRIATGIRWTMASVGLVLIATLGYFSTNRWIKEDHDQLITELPLIEQLDIYTEVDSLDFLKSLQESGLFNEEPTSEQP